MAGRSKVLDTSKRMLLAGNGGGGIVNAGYSDIRGGAMKNWTIERKSFESFRPSDYGYQAEVNAEHVSGKIIHINNFKVYKTPADALRAIEKILQKIPLEEIGEEKI